MIEPVADPDHDPFPSARDALREAVDRIAWEIDEGVVPRGDQAALRRARSGDLGGPAFWKVAAERLEPSGLLPATQAPWRDDAERRWVVIVAGMVEMAGLHARGRHLGRVLAETGVSEDRVLRLLRAHDASLLYLIRPLVHQLSAARAKVDMAGLAQLVLSDGGPRESSVRRGIALDFYRSASVSREAVDSD